MSENCVAILPHDKEQNQEVVYPVFENVENNERPIIHKLLYVQFPCNLQTYGIHIVYILLKFKLYLLNVIVVRLLVSLCLSSVSVVTAIKVPLEESKPFLFLQFEGKWVTSVFARSYTISCKLVLIFTISYVKTRRRKIILLLLQLHRREWGERPLPSALAPLLLDSTSRIRSSVDGTEETGDDIVKQLIRKN